MAKARGQRWSERSEAAQLKLAAVAKAGAAERKRQRAAEAEARRRRGGRPRKPAQERGMSHATRPELARRHPVHITVRIAEGVPNLRKRRNFRVARRVLRAAARRFGQMFQIVEFSVQANHLHVIVEAENRRELSRGMQGLGIRLAKNFNLHFRRKGALLDDRYHAHVLRTRAEIVHALRYVRKNEHLHDWKSEGRATWLTDPCSTDDPSERAALPSARSWLLQRARDATGSAPPTPPSRGACELVRNFF